MPLLNYNLFELDKKAFSIFLYIVDKGEAYQMQSTDLFFVCPILRLHLKKAYFYRKTSVTFEPN